MATTARPSFGIMTPPMNVGYDDIVRVWREADDIPGRGHRLSSPVARRIRSAMSETSSSSPVAMAMIRS